MTGRVLPLAALAALLLSGCKDTSARLPAGDYAGTLPGTRTAIELVVGGDITVDQAKARFGSHGHVFVRDGPLANAELACVAADRKATELTCTATGSPALGASMTTVPFPMLRL